MAEIEANTKRRFTRELALLPATAEAKLTYSQLRRKQKGAFIKASLRIRVTSSVCTRPNSGVDSRPQLVLRADFQVPQRDVGISASADQSETSLICTATQVAA
jgi:hypothetical protein